MGGKHFTTACTISRNGHGVSLSALANTGANGYIFINTRCALDAAKFMNTTAVRLQQPLPVRGFNGQSGAPVTHAIILHMKVAGRRQKDQPMLIANLGQHDLIIGRKWLEENDIWLDVRNRRMIWPDERPADGPGLIRELVT